MKPAEVTAIVLLDDEGLIDRPAMEQPLKREGLRPIGGELLAYLGRTTTDPVRTMLYVQDGVKKALHKGGFISYYILVSIGDYPMVSYRFDRQCDGFLPQTIQQETP